MLFKWVLFLISIYCGFNISLSVDSDDSELNDPNDDFETFLDMPPINGRNALTFALLKWPSGIIPFELDNTLDDIEKERILNSIEIFREKTCIKLIPKQSNHYDWLLYEKGKGCGTGVGYWKGRTSPMKLTMTAECLKLGVAIQHETMHVMGLFHEQCRYDRDEYIDILWENIPASRRKNFVKVPKVFADSYGIEYEYESLMHYKGSAFAKKGTNVTMRPKKLKDDNGRDIVLGYVGGPTDKDLLKINRMYDCKEFL